MWNFKGYLWNSIQNILPIHWKINLLWNIEILRALRVKSSYAFLKRPPDLDLPVPPTRFHEMTASAWVPHCDCRTWSNLRCLVISAVPCSINLTKSIGKYHNSSWEFDSQLRLRRVRHATLDKKNTGWIYTDTLARCHCNYNKPGCLRQTATGRVHCGLYIDVFTRQFGLCNCLWTSPL